MNEIKKIEVIKKLLVEENQRLNVWTKALEQVDEKYIGAELEYQKELWNKSIFESQTVIEALENYIQDLKDFEQLDADTSKAEALAQEGVETTESKIQAEELNK